MPTPVPTGTCDMAEKTLPSGWSHTYKGETQGSADIALIVELANCNKDKNLQQFLKFVRVQLRRADIRK